MTSKLDLLEQQRAWATHVGSTVDARGYLVSVAENLFQPLSPRAHQAFTAGSGSEMRDMGSRPAKMKALHSSAALAVNFFDYWSTRNAASLHNALGIVTAPATIDFEAQFPTGLEGNPPNLDVAFRFDTDLVVAVESKFSEWLTSKSPNKEIFKSKYFPDTTGLWLNKGLPACQALAADMHAGATHFRYLDAGQLLKHALGLATRPKGTFDLHYIFFDWPGPQSIVHRDEAARFERLVGNELRFRWGSYQEAYGRLVQAVGGEHRSYITYLRDRYFPNAV